MCVLHGDGDRDEVRKADVGRSCGSGGREIDIIAKIAMLFRSFLCPPAKSIQ